ncbi:MAG: phage protein Gp36 family protein [Bacteroidota bacterium]
MAYLVLDDYKSDIKASNLDAMVNSDVSVRTTAEDEAESMIKTYLNQLYDTATIFAQTGTDRHPHLMSIMKAIVLHKLHGRLPKRMMPDNIQASYNEAVIWLEKVNDGKISLELPRKTDSDDKTITRFRYGGNTPKTH